MSEWVCIGGSYYIRRDTVIKVLLTRTLDGEQYLVKLFYGHDEHDYYGRAFDLEDEAIQFFEEVKQ